MTAQAVNQPADHAHSSACSAEHDLMLLHRFTETGDSAAFAEIVQRYARVVYSASIRILGDEGGAQDVSQETFFRLMQRPRLVTHSLAGWLHRTATHVALDIRRAELSRKNREVSYGLEQQQQQLTKPARPTWAEISPFVDQALNEIKEPIRSLLIRHYLQGVPQQDLAAELEVSPATLSRRVKAGLEELQGLLRKRGIHLGVAVLATYCTQHAQAAVPTALVTEMGKMNLIASVKQISFTPTPGVGPYPPKYPLKPDLQYFIPAKFFAFLIFVTVLMGVYMYKTVSTWLAIELPIFHTTESVEHTINHK